MELYHKVTRADLECRLIRLWSNHEHEYKTMQDEYERLFEERKRLGIPANGVRGICKTEKEDWPEIRSLRLSTIKELDDYMDSLNDKELYYETLEIELLEYNRVYRDYQAKIYDLRHQLKNHDWKQEREGYCYGFDPNYGVNCCSNGRSFGHHGGSSSLND